MQAHQSAHHRERLFLLAAILNVPHPNLVHSAVEPNVYLRIVADTTVQPAQLSAEWIQMDGREMWDVKLDETMLRR